MERKTCKETKGILIRNFLGNFVISEMELVEMHAYIILYKINWSAR